MVPLAGLKPATYRLGGGCSFTELQGHLKLEPPVGIEPTTPALQEQRSAKLSYGGLVTSCDSAKIHLNLYIVYVLLTLYVFLGILSSSP